MYKKITFQKNNINCNVKYLMVDWLRNWCETWWFHLVLKCIESEKEREREIEKLLPFLFCLLYFSSGSKKDYGELNQ